MGENNPNTESEDFKAMESEWQKISDILAGADAVKEAGTSYLPRYGGEDDTAYEVRKTNAPWRPEFADALNSLCAKPFTKDVALQGDPPAVIQETFVEDVDGKGHNLHVFARDMFRKGVAKGLHAIYVAYPDTPPGKTRAEERARGARPYWIQVEANQIIALYTKMKNGREVVEHCRIRECRVTRVGFEEVEEDLVRVLELNELDQPTSTLYKKDEDATAKSLASGGDEVWVIEKETVVLEGVEDIPLVLYFTGERSGNYRVRPPLSDLAEMQMEIYRVGARKEEVLTYAGSPMLKGVGMAAPKPQTDRRGNIIETESDVTIGPRAILWCPPSRDGIQTDWNFVQPDANNIQQIRQDLADTITDFRRLAMQPTTPMSGTMTATGTAVESAKAHSQVEAWAMTLKDALEQAFVYTCQWMNQETSVEVFVHTDFGIDISQKDIADLLKMRMAGEISQDTFFDELLRRGFLGPQFDKDEEVNRLEEEGSKEDPTDGMAGLMPGVGDNPDDAQQQQQNDGGQNGFAA